MSFEEIESNNYLEYLKKNFKSWTSGNEQIDNFVQEMQLNNIKGHHDIIFEWIPYNQFYEIKETKKNDFITVYSAIWKDGPLCKIFWSDKRTRSSNNKEVALKCLHNSCNPIESLINEVKRYSVKKLGIKIYGISQNPDTNDYILVQYNFIVNWMSGNEITDNFIQEMQLETNYTNIAFEWIPYNQFYEIKEMGKSGFMTVYSAIWKDGPLCKNVWDGKCTRNSNNKEVVLKYLHNSHSLIKSLINEVKRYSVRKVPYEFLKIYGISQNPDTNDYILIQNNSINLVNWMSGNEQIDNFIQEMLLETNYSDISFEWIPYNQLYAIKETGKNDLMTLYSAIWKDGPLHYNSKNERNSNKEVVLKCLHDSHNLIESLLINEVKKYLVKKFCYKSLKLYGISQNSDTNDYILIFNWTSGNDKIDNFIQEMQLKPNHSDIVFEWIPYNQLYDIKETGKDSFMTVYSAIWKDGPLYYNYRNKDHYIRNSNIKVALKCLHNSHNPIDSLMNEVKTYSVKMFGYNKFIEVYGISQNPSTNNYILVQNNFINLVTCMSGNEKIDDLIQTIQLKSNNSDIIFEWIPYDQFYEVKENGKNDLMTIFSAICKDGPLHYDYKNDYYTRSSNEKVALKCMHSLQSPIECLINEVKKYSAKIFGYEFIKIYGISQNPDTNDYILVQNNTINLIDWTSGNEKIDDFIKEMQFKTNNPDIVIKWISYSQFDEIKEIGKGGFATIYSAILNDFKVALKCLDNSQNLIDELLNEVKAYKVLLNNSRLSRILKVYGISQDPDTRNYIIVLYYAEGGNFNNWININENYKCFNWQNKIRILYSISNGLKEIHEKQMVHRDFHTGNILFNTPFREEYANRIYISDMGLCGNVNNINRNNNNNIYGVMPYIAPEVLRGKPYTQAADIYSLGMIMHFVATGSQPFGNRAHDHNLVLDIYNEIRPEINEPEAPKSYIDLMKKCWDSNPENRPNITEFIESLRYISVSEIEEAENYRNLHLSTLKGDRKITTHPQAVYTSRLLNPFTECLDCAITD